MNRLLAADLQPQGVALEKWRFQDGRLAADVNRLAGGLARRVEALRSSGIPRRASPPAKRLGITALRSSMKRRSQSELYWSGSAVGGLVEVGSRLFDSLNKARIEHEGQQHGDPS